MRQKGLWVLIASIVFGISAEAQTPVPSDVAVRVMTYNGLKWGKSDNTARGGFMRTVMTAVQPDVLVMQEMVDAGGAEVILNLLNADSMVFGRAAFVDGEDTDNMLFYRKSKVRLVSQDTIGTELRAIGEYVLTIGAASAGADSIGRDTLRVYSCHLKASTGSANVASRFAEVSRLRTKLNGLTAGTEFIIVGDMNFYTSSEAGYQKFIADEGNNRGRAKDWLAAGSWGNSVVFAGVHSQSTRLGNIGDGGATGGLDDRFDFILTSYHFNDGARMEYVEGTMKAFGNDGAHFNLSVNAGTNAVVSAEVAEALYRATDHLPVVAELVSKAKVMSSAGAMQDGTATARGFELRQNYPNPFNPETVISYRLSVGGEVSLKVFDVLGREVAALAKGRQSSGEYRVRFQAAGLPSGVYFYRLTSGAFSQTKRMVIVK